MMNEYHFYDTGSLLLRADDLFDKEENIIISSITLNELEHIKTASNKDLDVKYAARRIIHLLSLHPDEYICHIFKPNMLAAIDEKNLSITEDMKILATAIDFDRYHHPDETIFITNDLALKNIANLFFGADMIQSVQNNNDDYTGYLEVVLDDEKMIDFYQNPTKNTFNLYKNEYLNIYNSENELVDTLCWTGSEYRHLIYRTFSSVYFGDVKPYQKDSYQAMLCDSLTTNQFTLVRGPAGSGKTFLSLSYLFYLLDRGKINKIIVFCNTVATKDSAKLGLTIG